MINSQKGKFRGCACFIRWSGRLRSPGRLNAVAQMADPPDRPIKMIVPLAAASAVDVAARIVTQKMADNMGQQFAILNQPGASGTDRRRARRARRAGRLHDRRVQRQRHDHGAEPAVQDALGHPEGFRTGIAGGDVEWGLIAKQSGQLQDRGRPDRGRKGCAWQDRLWLGRAGQPAASGDGDVRLRCRDIADACAVQGRNTGRNRRRRRPHSGRLSGPRYGRGAGARRFAQTDRGDHREKVTAIP